VGIYSLLHVSLKGNTMAANKRRSRREEIDEAKDAIDPMLNTHEAAAVLNCSASTLNKKRCKGGGPPFTYIGEKLVRYPLSGLKAYIRAGMATSTSAPKPDRAAKYGFASAEDQPVTR